MRSLIAIAAIALLLLLNLLIGWALFDATVKALVWALAVSAAGFLGLFWGYRNNVFRKP